MTRTASTSRRSGRRTGGSRPEIATFPAAVRFLNDRTDIERMRVVRYEEQTAQGDVVETRTFAEYDIFDGVFVPRRIILQRPLDDTSISMYYRELTLNPPTLSMTLRVGDSVEWVLIDENTSTSND